jgi:hypothetical protein
MLPSLETAMTSRPLIPWPLMAALLSLMLLAWGLGLT